MNDYALVLCEKNCILEHDVTNKIFPINGTLPKTLPPPPDDL